MPKFLDAPWHQDEVEDEEPCGMSGLDDEDQKKAEDDPYYPEDGVWAGEGIMSDCSIGLRGPRCFFIFSTCRHV